jgi:hypothetical protein
LLSDPEISRLINTEFVACWDTVRPVPKVTIDFGNGKVLKRTLTGNTVISVCLPDGRALDAFPGVYTPADFKAQIAGTLKLYREIAAAKESPELVSARVVAWHREGFIQGVRAEGARTTMSKALVESPLLRALGLPGRKALVLGSEPPAPRAEPQAVLVGPEAQLVAIDRQPVPRNGLEEVVSLKATPPTPVKPTAILDPLLDPKGAFAALSQRIDDASKQAASVEQVRRGFAPANPAARKTPEQIGREAIEIDSLVNVRAIRPAVHLWYLAHGGLPANRLLRDELYRDLLHVPVDDPYLGLTGAAIPGTP